MPCQWLRFTYVAAQKSDCLTYQRHGSTRQEPFPGSTVPTPAHIDSQEKKADLSLHSMLLRKGSRQVRHLLAKAPQKGALNRFPRFLLTIAFLLQTPLDGIYDETAQRAL